MKSTTMTLRIPLEIRDRLDYLAESTQRTRSALACEAISHYLDFEAKQAAKVRPIGSATGSVGNTAKKCAA